MFQCECCTNRLYIDGKDVVIASPARGGATVAVTLNTQEAQALIRDLEKLIEGRHD